LSVFFEIEFAAALLSKTIRKPMKKTLLKNKALRLSALSLAVSFCFASTSFAQNSEGSIYGRLPAKAQITITNLENGSTRSVQTENDGSYNISRLQPGRYKVSAGAKTQEVTVTTGSGTEVKFADVNSGATVVVTGSRVRQAIDMSSTESNTVFSAAEIAALPVGRNTTAVALLAPGTVQGSAGLGNLASIGGASVAENAYYINGLDVTNIRNFLSYISLPFEAIGEQQIKTGGYGAEFGRSLGGVINLTTKSGTNTWKGGASFFLNPKSLLKVKPKNIIDSELYGDSKTPTRYRSFGHDNSSETVNGNVYLGGPIIKDKLFVFGMLTTSVTNGESFGRTTSGTSHSQSPQGLVKFDFLPSAEHRFEITAIGNKPSSESNTYNNSATQDYSLTHNGTPTLVESASSSSMISGKYTGYITDNFTVSALVGGVKEFGGRQTNLPPKKNFDCPQVYDKDVNYLGCWNLNGVSSDLDPKAPANSDTRKSGRLDLEYNLGTHTLRAGYDAQKFTTAQAGSITYSGGKYYRYFNSAKGTVNNVTNAVPAGGEYVRLRTSGVGSGIFDVINTAKYIEDSWKVTPNVLVNGGLRWESFENKNSKGESFVKKDNLLAPRFGGAWNVFGDGQTKIYGNLGRYYIPVASNTNVRSTRFEYSNEQYFTFTGKDPRTMAPVTLGPEIGKAITSGDLTAPDPGKVADTKLNPMSQDEIILGFQQAISKNLAIGAKYNHRTVNNGMDDFCGTTGIGLWMKANGYTKFNANSLATCMLMNPGKDLNINADVANNGVLVPVTIPNSYLKLPKYSRTYDDLQFTVDRPFDGKWSLSGSYTLSKNRGTSEGYVTSNTDQADAGVTAEFDFASLTDGNFGPTPNQRTHSLKVFGVYAINDSFTVSFNSSLVSGKPITCLGGPPTDAWDYLGANGGTKGGAGSWGFGGAYYCLNGQFKTNADGTKTAISAVVPRGSVGRLPWTKTFDVSGTYKLKTDKGIFILSASIFNLFNFQTVQTVYENKDYSASTQAEGRVNLNYLQPSSYQGPRSARISARYEF
jgi:hypothetical protein